MSQDKPQTTPGAGGAQPYRVLARKYRPQTFDDLIGQDAMVRTLTNAFETGRIAQAYMLTGVRGVGKTTTARLIARALNYRIGEEDTGPSIAMKELGEHCAAIMESRHVDVIEMDAASNTGIDDVREIIESARYRPVSARYKVYIIDEVHMLSKAAFNGLLKTLEEPPPHVKFIFATTEIRKVPVTVLSRCQRFDLRRIDAGLLVDHLGGIAEKEGARVEPEALALIARAAEGSVRDGLSLLDQAIALGGDTVSSEQVRDMLGLVDRARSIDLLDHVMGGNASAALEEFRSQYDAGADPVIVLTDLARLVHWLTRLKLVETARDDPAMSEAERTRGGEMAAKLSMRSLARAWQMLLKGVSEVQMAHNPMAAADMVLIRLCHVADLPAPDELVRSLTGDTGDDAGPSAPQPAPSGNGGAPRGRAAPASRASGSAVQAVADAPPMDDAPPVGMAAPEAKLEVPQSFLDVVKLAAEKRDIRLKTALERSVSPVRFERGHIEIALAEGGSAAIANELSAKLSDWTGERWVVSLSREQASKTLHQEASERREALLAEVRADPLIEAVMENFPGAAIVDVREERGPAFDNGEADAHMDSEQVDGDQEFD